MMKCSYCGGPLNLEEEVCAYCGAKNEQAVKHIENMKKYSRDYEKTKKDVYTTAKKNTSLTVKSLIIAVLLILIAICSVAVVTLEDVLTESKHKKESENVIAVKDELIKGKKYGLLGILLKYNLYRDYLDNYSIYANYFYIYQKVLKLQDEKLEKKEKEERIDYLVDEINGFYEKLERGRNLPNEDVTEKDIEDIEKQIKAMLVGFCNLSKEEAKDFLDMSNGERILLLEERLINEK